MTAEWAYSTLGSQFDVQLGKMLDAARNEGELKPFIGNRAVQWGRVDANASGLVPLSRLDMQRFRLREGDLLVCEGGEVGRAAIWRDQLPECYYQKALHRLRPRRGYDVRLMQALLEYWASVDGFRDYVTQTSIAHLPREKIVTIPLPLPSTHEQRRIGDVLDEVDKLITTLERLIAKKQAIKQGMMQQLLTGRTRLPGFSGEWHSLSIGDMCSMRSGSPKARTTNGRYWVIDMGSVTRDADLVVTRKTNDAGDLLSPGELVMPKDDIGGGQIIGRTGLIERHETYVLADHVYALTPRDVDASFLNFAINSYPVNTSLRSQATGSAQLGLARGSVLRQQIFLPCGTDEQQAIARLLTNARLEISSLQRRLDKARDIKTGMMQQLLTGRVRLQVDVES